MNEFEFAEKYINPTLGFILFKILRLRKHNNNLGLHFYLPIKPQHSYCLDLWLARINIFWPLYVSISFGLLGKVGLQVALGIKFDPTETAKLNEYDYLLSTHFRKHQLGNNCRINSEASF